MNNHNPLENLEEHFKKINYYSEEYNYCFECSTIQNNYFGAIGAIISIKKNKNIMGYLLNKTEKGICLIPIVADTLTKNKVDLEHFIFIEDKEIENVIIKNEDFTFKKINIALKDKTKFILKTPKKIRNIAYHEINLNKFIDSYK